MKRRGSLGVAGALPALLVAALALSGCAPRGHRHVRSELGKPAHMGVERADQPGLVMTSQVLERDAGFDEVLLSWDIRVPADGGAELSTRVRSGDVWSAWLTVATRGVALPGSAVRADPLARVDVDMIVCSAPCDAVQWRVSASGPGAVELRDVWVTTTAIGADKAVREAGGLEPIEHRVPHKAQREAGEELGGRLCSPTSVAMVVASRGVDVAVLAVAERAYDGVFDLYGNWVNNTLAACELGVPMRVTRIGSWAEARSYLERGPIVISLPPFNEQELTGSGYSSASGHLIVVAGLDATGGVIVRDPAHGDDARRVYRRAQLTRLWLVENKGTAYVLDADD